MAEDILCRVTVGLANPHDGTPVRPGSYVLVSPDDPKFAPLIGKYLVPCSPDGEDLPEAQWATAALPSPPEPDPEPEPELEADAPVADASERPQEPTGDAATVEPDETPALWPGRLTQPPGVASSG